VPSGATTPIAATAARTCARSLRDQPGRPFCVSGSTSSTSLQA